MKPWVIIACVPWHDSPYMCGVTYSRGSWLMANSNVWHDVFICGTWLMMWWQWEVTHCESSSSVWVICTGDMTYLRAGHHVIVISRGSWLLHMIRRPKGMCTHTWMSHVPHMNTPCPMSMCATWSMHMWDMTHLFILPVDVKVFVHTYISAMCMSYVRHTLICAPWLIHSRNMTHYEWVMPHVY